MAPGDAAADMFRLASWHAAVVRCDVNFDHRRVTYQDCHGEEYAEGLSRCRPGLGTAVEHFRGAGLSQGHPPTIRMALLSCA
jgi:hypothetical protein